MFGISTIIAKHGAGGACPLLVQITSEFGMQRQEPQRCWVQPSKADCANMTAKFGSERMIFDDSGAIYRRARSSDLFGAEKERQAIA